MLVLLVAEKYGTKVKIIGVFPQGWTVITSCHSRAGESAKLGDVLALAVEMQPCKHLLHESFKICTI